MGKSTRKNPDKYIERLKRDLRESYSWRKAEDKYRQNERERYAKEIAQLKGEFWLTLTEKAQYCGYLSDTVRLYPRLNQKVVIRGVFTKLERTDKEEYPNLFVISLTDVSLKED